jgi:hypothetical protein
MVKGTTPIEEREKFWLGYPTFPFAKFFQGLLGAKSE